MVGYSFASVGQYFGPGFEVPSHWAVIYNEAIFGNHILFTKDDIKEFEASDFNLLEGVSNNAWVENLGVDLLKLGSVSSIHCYLKGLSKEQRRCVYSLYRRWLVMMNQSIKLHSN